MSKFASTGVFEQQAIVDCFPIIAFFKRQIITEYMTHNNVYRILTFCFTIKFIRHELTQGENINRY